MSVTFYMDVHVRRAVTVARRLRDVDVLAAQEDGSAELDDTRLMDRATELGRVLVSQDEDLLREGAERLSERQAFSGLIYAHQLRITIGQMVEDLELREQLKSNEGIPRVQAIPASDRHTSGRSISRIAPAMVCLSFGTPAPNT